jgi:multiple sugar transport system permease protein
MSNVAGRIGPEPETVRDRRRQARRQRREEAERGTLPLRVYGLRRGTVPLITALCALFAVFTLAPIVWIVINSTKTQANIFYSFGFWFAKPFALGSNLSLLFHNVDGYGTYIQWLGNTALYAVVGGLGATVFATFAGYGFAMYRFGGSKSLFYVMIAALLVPITAITLPLYLLYTKVGLINSPWGMILPSAVSPVGAYIMRTYITSSVPRELISAARIDGASELRIFYRVALPLVGPGFLTVLLLSIVGIWNNYFLPLIIFSKNSLYPLTQGIGLWSKLSVANGDAQLFPLTVVGGLVTIIPLVLLFLVVQRYWRGGLLLGSVVG